MTRAAFISRDSQFSFLARHAPALLSVMQPPLACEPPEHCFTAFYIPNKRGARASERVRRRPTVAQELVGCAAPFGEHGAHLFTLRLLRPPSAVQARLRGAPASSLVVRQAGDELCR